MSERPDSASVEWLRRSAAVLEAESRPLPSASAILWRARLRPRRNAAEPRVRRTLRRAQWSAAGAIVLGVAIAAGSLLGPLPGAVERGELELLTLGLAGGGTFVVVAALAASVAVRWLTRRFV